LKVLLKERIKNNLRIKFIINLLSIYKFAYKFIIVL